VVGNLLYRFQYRIMIPTEYTLLAGKGVWFGLAAASGTGTRAHLPVGIGKAIFPGAGKIKNQPCVPPGRAYDEALRFGITWYTKPR